MVTLLEPGICLTRVALSGLGGRAEAGKPTGRARLLAAVNSCQYP